MLPLQEPNQNFSQTQGYLVDRAVAALSGIPRPSWLPMHWQDLCFDVVTDPETLMRSFELRYHAYSECGYISVDDFPVGLEMDRFDDRAVHFVARRESSKKLVGYTRLLMGNPVQMEDMLDISDYRRRYSDRICEMSRLIVYPIGQRYASRGLRNVAIRWAEETGIACIVGVSLERDEEAFTRRWFLPMQPRRRCLYADTYFRLLAGAWLYGNYFDVEQSRLCIRKLVSTPGKEMGQELFPLSIE
jgi:Acetyltransferase (GNAT) domain